MPGPASAVREAGAWGWACICEATRIGSSAAGRRVVLLDARNGEEDLNWKPADGSAEAEVAFQRPGVQNQVPSRVMAVHSLP